MKYLFFQAAILIALISFSIPEAAGSPSAHSSAGVLIINSYRGDFSWVAAHNGAIAQALAGAATITTFDLDTKNLPAERHAAQADSAFSLYRKLLPDLVILSDDNALKLLGQRLVDTGAKVLYLGINNNPRAYLSDPRKATGVLERPLLRRSVALAVSTLGHTQQKALILFDASPTSTVLFQEVFGGKSQSDLSGITTDFLMTNSSESWQETITNAKENGYGFIALGLRHTLCDASGKHIDPDKATLWAASNSPVPLFGFWDFDIGPGKTVGGLVLTGAGHGRIAGELALRILSGEPVSSIPPVHDRQGIPMFSRSGLASWGLPLPPAIEAEAVLTP